MFQKLCQDIGSLDGNAIAERVTRIDLAIEERRTTATDDLRSRLSPAAVKAVMDNGATAVSRIQGSHTDVIEFARRFPEYVKAQYTDRCVSFGYIDKPGSD